MRHSGCLEKLNATYENVRYHGLCQDLRNLEEIYFLYLQTDVISRYSLRVDFKMEGTDRI